MKKFQYSVKSLLIAVLLSVFLSYWISSRFVRFHRMQSLTEKIQASGGDVDWVSEFIEIRDSESGGGFLYPLETVDGRDFFPNLWSPRYLNIDLNQECVSQCREDIERNSNLVTSVRCDSCDLSGLRFGSALKYLKVTAEDSGHIASCVEAARTCNLKGLDIETSQLQDAWIDLLEDNSMVRTLDIVCFDGQSSGTRLIETLSRIRGLEKLSLCQITLSKQDVQALCRMPRIRELSMLHTGLTQQEILELTETLRQTSATVVLN